MSDSSIGVAFSGAGMAGLAHINRYRGAMAVFWPGLPEIRLAAVADAGEPFTVDPAQRYGYQRAETSWEAIAAAPDIGAVSVRARRKGAQKHAVGGSQCASVAQAPRP